MLLSNMNITSVSAAEESFTLDPLLVTAQRYETRELETPASVTVINEEQIKGTGANNAVEVLKYTLGVSYAGIGPGGTSYANSSATIDIRGVEDGTLVMLNGRPINTRGLAFLDKYPANNIAKIEVIRGGGAVLYGSNAMGGVINIITKTKQENYIVVDGGNFGQRNASAGVQVGKLGVNYNYNHWGNVDKLSLGTWQSIADKNPVKAYFNNNLRGSHADNIALDYKFDDKWSAFYSYNNKDASYIYSFYENNHKAAGKERHYRNFEHRQSVAQLNYDDGHFKAGIYYNDLAYRTKAIDFLSSSGGATNSVFKTSADERNNNLGFDAQYNWDKEQGKYLVGFSAQREYYKPATWENKDYSRMNYSVYSSTDYKFSALTKAILSMRYAWTASSPHPNLSKFTPQLQVMHEIAENSYLYANAGTSYTIPTFKQTGAVSTSNVIGNPDLKPQTGKHYEIGWKKNYDNHAIRVAAFNYKIKDRITASNIGPNKYSYENEDLKNTGLEVDYSYKKEKDKFHYNIGFTVGNPKTKNTRRPSGRSRIWERSYERFQINASVGYVVDKWSVNLLGKYVFGKTHSSLDSVVYGPERVKPAFYTSLNTVYKIDSKQEVYLRVENILDRKDIINYSSSEYYATPVNFVLGYNFKF